ncbi:MAG TPA: arginine--tRNA ligase, partial [Candidatus Saccharimonadales bacterium]|nr:arginine--tRNA ligase [Candidatus Saccharimonadales bacterium]
FFEGKMEPVIKELQEKGLLAVGKEGAKIVEFGDSAKLPPLMILKKDGATLYSTRDLATDKFRIEKYGKDVLIINEVGMEQSLYFQQLYKVEEMLGWFKNDQRVHLKHGLIRFKDGKMSTRKGNTIWLEDVLDAAVHNAKGIGVGKDLKKEWIWENGKPIGVENGLYGKGSEDKIAKQVGIGAIKWNDLKRDSKQDIMFDWDDVLNMQGNSGPYIQYVFARTQSVIARSETTKQSVEIDRSASLAMTDYKFEIEERELLRLLARFDEVITEAAERLAPNIICTYLFELAQAFNLFYQKCPIIKSEEDVREFRLSLTDKTGEVIKTGLNLLGIEAPSKM